MIRYYLIEENKLRQLLKAKIYLDTLENGGVDDWEWYGESLNDYLKEYCAQKGIDFLQYDFDELVEEDLSNYIEYKKEEIK